jgi:hypothetical protein
MDYINDFNFPENETNIGKRHFEIKYDLSTDEYKIKNLSGTGLFIKIENKILLRNNSIFSFSNIIFNCKIDISYNNDNNNISSSTLTLKIIYGINEGKEYSFNSNIKKTIKIGRLKNPEIDIDLNDESTSRIQSTIFYENNNWYIIDGDIENKKPSLNGTWYFADKYITITEGMIFRAGTTSFKSHLVSSKN